jgi:dTDP-4-amino-4,6-dideoxygalactose transaminase
MDPIMELATQHGVIVMEDAAHGMGGAYKGRKLGSIGHFGGFSLHEVKNINSLGEGGILLSNEDWAGPQFPAGRFLGRLKSMPGYNRKSFHSARHIAAGRFRAYDLL